jgi:ATP-dependent Clp protease adaptor protein ClpS
MAHAGRECPACGRVGAQRERRRAGGMGQTRDDTVLEAQKSKLKPPSMFKVMLLNDDYTPMEFVVLVLQKFFDMTRERATQVMLKVHREGIGICGVYPRDVAATKVQQVGAYARKHQHPLQCVMEET